MEYRVSQSFHFLTFISRPSKEKKNEEKREQHEIRDYANLGRLSEVETKVVQKITCHTMKGNP